MSEAESTLVRPSFVISEEATAEQRKALERFMEICQTNPGVLLNALSLLSMHQDAIPITRNSPQSDIFDATDTVQTLLRTRADEHMDDIDKATETEIHRDPIITALRQQQASMSSNSLSATNTEAKERLRDQFRLRNLAVFAGRAVIASSVASHSEEQKKAG